MGSIGLRVIQGKCVENKNGALRVSQFQEILSVHHDSPEEQKNRGRQTKPSSEHAG